MLLLAAAAAWACFALLRVNYAFLSFGITSYVVLLFALAGLPEPEVALRRTLATLLGGIIALMFHMLCRLAGRSVPGWNAVWTGVSLADVLRAARIRRDGAWHVAFSACDACNVDDEQFRYAASIPITKALSPDVLLAYEVNGAPLAPEHGFPLRVVVPGFAGARSVKWLAAITVQPTPSDAKPQAQAPGLGIAPEAPAPAVALRECDAWHADHPRMVSLSGRIVPLSLHRRPRVMTRRRPRLGCVRTEAEALGGGDAKASCIAAPRYEAPRARQCLRRHAREPA